MSKSDDMRKLIDIANNNKMVSETYATERDNEASPFKAFASWGELSEDTGKVLFLEEADRIKYPRTYHLPWTETMAADDKMIKTLEHFIDQDVVVTEKMDGENTTLTSEYMHARSVDSNHHPSRDWVKGFHAQRKNDIPPNWRICGENLYAKHSIEYKNLSSYFYGFSIWNDQNVALSWDETLEWFNLLEINPVPILYRGIFDEKVIKKLWNPNNNNTEGYVMRVSGTIPYADFTKKVAKFVRNGHVQPNATHWSQAPITPNKLS